MSQIPIEDLNIGNDSEKDNSQNNSQNNSWNNLQDNSKDDSASAPLHDNISLPEISDVLLRKRSRTSSLQHPVNDLSLDEIDLEISQKEFIVSCN